MALFASGTSRRARVRVLRGAAHSSRFSSPCSLCCEHAAGEGAGAAAAVGVEDEEGAGETLFSRLLCVWETLQRSDTKIRRHNWTAKTGPTGEGVDESSSVVLSSLRRTVLLGQSQSHT